MAFKNPSQSFSLDALKGQVPVGLVIPKDDFDGDEPALEEALVALVREQIGGIASLKQVLVVNRLPKTRSGKILRKLLRTIADGKEFAIPPTIDDPTSLQEVHDLMCDRDLGLAAQAKPQD